LDIAREQRAQVPDEVKNETKEYQEEYDKIIAFLREHGAIEGQPEDEVVAE
jgi:uncharacterized protein with WD repeat